MDKLYNSSYVSSVEQTGLMSYGHFCSRNKLNPQDGRSFERWKQEQESEMRIERTAVINHFFGDALDAKGEG